MLDRKDKIIIFEEYLNIKNNSYADKMKDEIYEYFFINENGLECLDYKSTEIEIISFTDLLITNMIMHEDEGGLHNIIENYL